MNKYFLSFITLTLLPMIAICAETKENLAKREDLSLATFAGGCFWCVEADFEKIPGVIEVISGFSGGQVENPSYKQVSTGTTGHLESVQVYFDPEIIAYKDLLQAFWRQVDPTDVGGQFVDRGEPYRTAIFYHNDEQKQVAEQSKQALQASGRYSKTVVTPIIPLTIFYEAEVYHQDYYRINPIRYKYYRYRSGRDQYLTNIWEEESTMPVKTSAEYVKPSDTELRSQLTSLQYQVTQKEATERPFDNPFWNETRSGIYVDIASGEPLFSSTDKYKSGTGWPSFTQPLKAEHIVEKVDSGLFSTRTEVRSKYGDSHLGHVFTDGPKPTGLRYCINSAALRFIPAEELEASQYKEYRKIFQDK